jgi:hypothetical protein
MLTPFIRLSVDIFFVSDSHDLFIKLWNLMFESYMEFSGFVVRLRFELLGLAQSIAPLYIVGKMGLRLAVFIMILVDSAAITDRRLILVSAINH